MSNVGNQKKSTTGIRICSFIFLIFLTLKLAKIGVVANWSWWWVTAPLWLPPSITLVVLAIIDMIIGINYCLKNKEDKP